MCSCCNVLVVFAFMSTYSLVLHVQSFGAFKLKSDTESSSSIRTGSLFQKNKPKLDAATALPATGCFKCIICMCVIFSKDLGMRSLARANVRMSVCHVVASLLGSQNF